MIIENSTSEQNNRLFRLFFLLITTIYSLIGIFYYQWGIFYFVYLFWFENFIKSIFIYIKVKSTRYIQPPFINNWERNNRQKNLGSSESSAKGKIFINILYFVFIVFGLGFFVLFIFSAKKDSAKNFMDTLSIILFMNREFNIALMILLTKEIIEYIRDFVISKKYNKNNKMEFPRVFGTNDLILHCSIIFGIGSSLALNHPAIGGRYGWDQSPRADYAIVIALITFKFVAGVYGVFKNINKEEEEQERNEMIEL